MTDVPNEVRFSRAWDSCLERTVYHTGYGALGGGLLAILPRTASGRFAALMFGVGVGLGTAVNQCQIEFEEAAARAKAEERKKPSLKSS